MKQIIERNLPLDTKYNLIDKNYIPILDGGGCVCQDCGRLISHIATVKSESKNKSYNVGFDCLEKLLLNNSLICNFNIETLKDYKKQLNKIIRFSKELKDIINNDNNVTSFYFEPQSYESDWFTYYIIYNNDFKTRYNMSKKLKGVKYKTLHTVLANILNVNVSYGYINK